MSQLEELQRAFIEASQMTARVKDQWGRVHRIDRLENKTRCGLKREPDWILSPTDGLDCVECR